MHVKIPDCQYHVLSPVPVLPRLRFRSDRLPLWASVSLHPPPLPPLLSPSQRQHRRSSTSYLVHISISTLYLSCLVHAPPVKNSHYE